MTDKTTDIKVYEELYKNLLNFPEFEKLEIELQKPNIFSILGIGRMEIRHSNFLAWLLNPNGSHGLGNKFLIRVLRDLALDNKNDLSITEISKLKFDYVDVKREHSTDKGKKIDILLVLTSENKKLVLCIENKIDSTDSDKQLSDYKKYIDDTYQDDKYEKVFVYLTPNGDVPNADKVKDDWHTYSYRENIIEHLEDILKIPINSTVFLYISDYLSTLKNEIMSKNDSARELANAIYENHKEIIDFVTDYKDTNRGNQLEWESDSKKWLKKEAEKFLSDLKEIDNANAKDYELGFLKLYISIRYKGQRIYSLWPNNKPKFTLEIHLDKNENKQDIVDLLRKEGIAESKSNNYFQINSFEKVLEKNPDILKKIQEIRFGLNQPKI